MTVDEAEALVETYRKIVIYSYRYGSQYNELVEQARARLIGALTEGKE